MKTSMSIRIDVKLGIIVIPISNVDRAKGSYASFTDPDGNAWVLQEITARLSRDIRPGDARSTAEVLRAIRDTAQTT